MTLTVETNAGEVKDTISLDVDDLTGDMVPVRIYDTDETSIEITASHDAVDRQPITILTFYRKRA